MKHAAWSCANSITATRCLLGTGLLICAALEASPSLLAFAVLACWAGDVADGLVARGLRCETLLGAQLDSYADRVVAFAALAAAIVIAHMALPMCLAALVIWAQFGVIDQFMSAQFLRFGLWTSDELHLVDELLWRLNFSALAKLLSNVPVALTLAGARGAWIAVALACTISVLRVAAFGARRCGGPSRVVDHVR